MIACLHADNTNTAQGAKLTAYSHNQAHRYEGVHALGKGTVEMSGGVVTGAGSAQLGQAVQLEV